MELRMLGADVADARLEQARRNEQARAAQRARRKQKQAEADDWPDADETLAFVAVCTPAGAPYGIHQDEADAAWEQELAWRRVMHEMDEDDDLPF